MKSVGQWEIKMPVPHSLRQEKGSIAFSQTGSGCCHEKMLLVAKQCAVRSIKSPNIAPQKLSCQSLLGVTETMLHGFYHLTVKGCVSNWL